MARILTDFSEVKPADQLWDVVSHWGKDTENMEENVEEWASYGICLGTMEKRLGWEIGDWWNRGERFGERVSIVNHPKWKGPSYQTCRNYGVTAKKFPLSRRRYNLSFSHHAALVQLDPKYADEQLRLAEKQQKRGNGLSAQEMRLLAKFEQRKLREETLNGGVLAPPTAEKLYSVILADPPWRFEPYSRATGLERAADNHYGTMATEDICELAIPAASNAVLYLWRTAPMLEQALAVMHAWGFEYKTEYVWVKHRVGTGYWTRNQHEILMVCTRGDIPAPAPGTQSSSVVAAKRTKHSQKPEIFYEIIEESFPTASKIELFATKYRTGWDAWGNEAPAGPANEEVELQETAA